MKTALLLLLLPLSCSAQDFISPPALENQTVTESVYSYLDPGSCDALSPVYGSGSYQWQYIYNANSEPIYQIINQSNLDTVDYLPVQ